MKILVIPLLLLAACAEPAPPADRLNVLVLFSDQHRGDALGCDGHPAARTPRLDALAAQGVRFTRAFVQAPLCVPSRASLATSRHPLLHRATSNACLLPPDEVTWSALLREEGYTTVSVGRAHGICAGFDHRLVPGSELLHSSPPPRVLPEKDHWDTRIADTAIEELEQLRDAERPFALQVGFFSPHPPHIPTRETGRAIEPADVLVPDLDEAYLAGRTSWQRRPPVRTANLRYSRALYLSMVLHLDKQIGRVLDALDELGLAEDTLVVYTSDHGSPLGDHGLRQKNLSFYESEVRVPLLMRLPGRLPAEAVVEELAQVIDVAPTAFALLGLQQHPGFQGRDLAPLWRGEQGSGDGLAYSMVDLVHAGAPEHRGLMVRDERWKLCWYTNGEGELYDLVEDPGELVNRFEDPAAGPQRDELWRRLVEHLVGSWARVPERAVAARGADRLTLLSVDPPRARLVRGEESLAAGVGGHRELGAGTGPERLRPLEEALVAALATGIGPPHHGDGLGGPCQD